MLIISYAIKIAVSTFIIWLSIYIVDRGNYRNKLGNAFVTAVVLSFAGNAPFIFLFGLVIWVYILINWYSIGFFKSFLCVIVYGVIFFLLNIFLAAALLGGTFTYYKMTDTGMYVSKWEEFKNSITARIARISETFRTKFLLDEKPIAEQIMGLPGKRVRIFFTNGRAITARILMEGRKGILVDIADGRSEVVIRRDQIDYIEDL